MQAGRAGPRTVWLEATASEKVLKFLVCVSVNEKNMAMRATRHPADEYAKQELNSQSTFD